MPIEVWSAERFQAYHKGAAFKGTKVGKRVADKHFGGQPPVLETRCAAPRKPRTKVVEVRPGEPVESVTVVLSGWPANVNRKSGEHWRVTAARVKAYHEHAAPLWQAAMNGRALAGDWFTIHIEYLGASRQDPHNCDKAAIDVAADAVGINDRRALEWGGKWRERTGERRHRVTLTAITET